MFGWCSTGHCQACPGKYQRFYIGTKKIKRRSVQAVIYLDEWVECDHRCHGRKPDAPVKKTRRRKK